MVCKPHKAILIWHLMPTLEFPFCNYYFYIDFFTNAWVLFEELGSNLRCLYPASPLLVSKNVKIDR